MPFDPSFDIEGPATSGLSGIFDGDGMFEVGNLVTTTPPGTSVVGAAFSTLTAINGNGINSLQDDDYDYTAPTGAIEVGTL